MRETDISYKVVGDRNQVVQACVLEDGVLTSVATMKKELLDTDPALWDEWKAMLRRVVGGKSQEGR